MTKDLSILREVLARKHIYRFAQYVMPGFQSSDFHAAYYNALNLFASGVIRRLIVTIPPQHGKSLGSSQLLPAYLLGLDPTLKIAIASYAFGLAAKFNKRTQRTMLSEPYTRVFPLSKLKANSVDAGAPGYAQTTEAFEVVGYPGGVQSVGRGGGLTGNEVDVMIIDDLYKDAQEGNSPTIRDAAFEWYTSVVKTRLHNKSRELIVFTRWHEDDLIGRLQSTERVIELQSFDQVDPVFTGWYKLNFEAIKEADPTEIDQRPMNAPLWPYKHDLDLLQGKRNLDRHAFDCMYQGRPASKEGLLYGDSFRTYTAAPEFVSTSNYTDTADTGDDRLCSICYGVGRDGSIYVTDVLYTSEPMEVTEPATAQMLQRNDIRTARIESNNGGRSFARAVEKLIPHVRIEWFHQSGNKESRILSTSATVMQNVVFPADWRLRWPTLYNDLTGYKRMFRANRWHDAPDVLAGIVEREVIAAQQLLPVTDLKSFDITELSEPTDDDKTIAAIVPGESFAMPFVRVTNGTAHVIDFVCNRYGIEHNLPAALDLIQLYAVDELRIYAAGGWDQFAYDIWDELHRRDSDTRIVIIDTPIRTEIDPQAYYLCETRFRSDWQQDAEYETAVREITAYQRNGISKPLNALVALTEIIIFARNNNLI